MGYLFILLTVLLTVYGQFVIKWQVTLLGPFPFGVFQRLHYFSQVLQSPWILSALLASFLAFISWVVALSKFDLGYAYPLTSLSYILVSLIGWYFWGEALSFVRIVGLCLIIIGVAISSTN